MIFQLTGDPGCELGQIGLHALENLAHSAVSGNQLVSADRSLLDAISKNPKLSERARAYYRRMSQDLTQLGRALGSIEKISIDIENESSVVAGAVIPVGVFSDAAYCEKTQLLVENLTDYEVLVGLAEILLALNFHGLQVSFRAQNGGGSTTAQVLTHLVSSPSGPVLCVVDSDRKFSGGGNGDTAKAVISASRRATDRWRLRLTVLAVRELENMIPSDLRLHCAGDLGVDCVVQVKELDKLNSIFGDFCCLKSGDSRCRMLGDAISKKKYEMISELGKIDSGKLRMSPKCGTCPYPDGCFSSPALGQGFLKKVGSALKGRKGQSSVAGWRSELRDLIGVVLHAGLAFPPQRI